MDGFIQIHNEIRCLVLFDCGQFDKICDRIKYFISEKMVLQIVLIKILRESELAHRFFDSLIFYILKKH